MSDSKPSFFKIWWVSARPKTLTAAVAPVMLGTVYLYPKIEWLYAILALIGALFIQIGTNFINDYYDHKKGADSPNRKGPLRALQQNWVSPASVKKAAAISFAIAFLCGIFLALRGGWPVIVVGLVSLLLGWLYTATPFSLAYTGLADFFAFSFFGPVASGVTAYVQSLEWAPDAFWIGAIPGAYSMALLTVNNLRDRAEDAQAGKKTLAVRFGETFAMGEYFLCIAIPPLVLWHLLPLAYFGAAVLPSLYALVLFYRLRLSQQNRRFEAFNPLLAATAKLLFLHSFWVGMIWILAKSPI